MSEETKFGISDITVGDDLDIGYDPDTYKDQANPAPPPTGNYNAVILSLDPRVRDGKPVMIEDKYPVFVLGVVEIIEGLGDGNTRKVGVFHEIGTKPFDRFGTPASGIADLTSALGSASWRGLDPQDPDSGVSRLREAFEQRIPFASRYDWSAYDGLFAKAAIAQLELPTKRQERTDEEQKVYNAIYRQATVRGMRFFPYNADSGRFSPVLQRTNVPFKNPVTNATVMIEAEPRTIEARLSISRFYPKKDVDSGQVTFGPANVKPAQVAA